eukprot:6732308-Prymnesium_polylepis.1
MGVTWGRIVCTQTTCEQAPEEATHQRAGCAERAQSSGSCWGAGEALPGGCGRERGLQEGTGGPGGDSSC